MKKVLSMLVVFVMVFGLVACGERIKNSENSSEITLCLDWTPNTNHTGFYVAAAKGYYEEMGLEVKIVQPPENGAALMCASGQAQFAIDAQDTLAPSLANDNPLEVSAVAAILQHNTSGIISRKGEGADRPKGLQNKTYSTWDNPTELAMVKHIVEKDGGDFEKVNLIPNVITDEAEALKNGDTDSVWIYYGWSGINAQMKGLSFDYFSFSDCEEIFDYYTPVIIGNNTFLETEKEKAKSFISATKKGYEYAAENPEEAAEILINGDDTGSLSGSEEFVKESQKWISEKYIDDASSFGIIDEDRWNSFYLWLFENGLIEKKLSENAGLNLDFIG